MNDYMSFTNKFFIVPPTLISVIGLHFTVVVTFKHFYTRRLFPKLGH
jgi:hypothetical protein